MSIAVVIDRIALLAFRKPIWLTDRSAVEATLVPIAQMPVSSVPQAVPTLVASSSNSPSQSLSRPSHVSSVGGVVASQTSPPRAHVSEPRLHMPNDPLYKIHRFRGCFRRFLHHSRCHLRHRFQPGAKSASQVRPPPKQGAQIPTWLSSAQTPRFQDFLHRYPSQSLSMSSYNSPTGLYCLADQLTAIATKRT